MTNVWSLICLCFTGGWFAAHNLWDAQLCGTRGHNGQGLLWSYCRFMVMRCYPICADGWLLAFRRTHYYGSIQEGAFLLLPFFVKLYGIGEFIQVFKCCPGMQLCMGHTFQFDFKIACLTADIPSSILVASLVLIRCSETNFEDIGSEP